MRKADIERARHLRAQGWLLQEIADEVKAGKGLVSLWVRGVQVPEMLRKKRVLHYDRLAKGRDVWSEKRRLERERFREEGRQTAMKGDTLHAVACALYWGEGAKSRNATKIVNSDVHILKKFLEFCRKYFSISNEGVAIKVFGYTNVHNKEDIVDYWVRSLDLEGAQHHQHQFDVTKYASRGRNPKTVGKLPYGYCCITIKKATHIVQHIYGALEVYGGAHLDPVDR